jgi:hypothetical protein
MFKESFSVSGTASVAGCLTAELGKRFKNVHSDGKTITAQVDVKGWVLRVHPAHPLAAFNAAQLTLEGHQDGLAIRYRFSTALGLVVASCMVVAMGCLLAYDLGYTGMIAAFGFNLLLFLIGFGRSKKKAHDWLETVTSEGIKCGSAQREGLQAGI